jgi:hypothetical protein
LIKLYFSIILLTFFSECASKTASSEIVAQTIPITMANLRGHQSLYNEGWFVITSSRDALDFAKKHAIDNAADALHKAKVSIASEGRDYASNIKNDIKDGLQTTEDIYDFGSDNSQSIHKVTNKLAKSQKEYASLVASDAWATLIKGNLSLAKRTKEDREALLNVRGHLFKELKNDFSNLGEIASSITSGGSAELGELWSDAFIEAKESFLESYEASGDSENSLMGLFHILFGYAKALYNGVVEPTTVTTVVGAYSVGEKLVKLAYLPIGATISVVGRSVESLGMTLYYTTALGIKVVSPTVEAGFLSALSILSLSSSGMTYVGGHSLGLVNQVGTLAAAPVGGIIQTGAELTVDTAKLVTFISYDVTKSAAKIIFNEASSGIVLGYNALVAIPTHLLLASSDSVFFLAGMSPIN